MRSRSALNGAMVAGVVALVVGVAWYKGERRRISGPGPETVAASGASAATTQAAGGKLPRVVDLGAEKCKACIELAPILKALKVEYAGRAEVEFIDVWKNPQAGEEYGIRMIPTQIFFDRDGKEVWRHEGFLPKAEFEAKLKELGA